MDKNAFKPAWWLPGAHLQTLWPTLCRKSLKGLNLERERFELPDGDFIDLVWAGRKGPIVVILHGLEGSVHSPYAQGMLAAITNNQWRGVFMHFRGCSGEPNRLPRSYHSGETNDLATVIYHLSKREPGVPIAAVGFSLGGNVLLKWLGETGEKNILNAAIAISVPFELEKVSRHVQKGFSKVYQWHFLNCLRKRLGKKFQQYPVEMELPDLYSLKTLWDFDEKITAPLHGFKSVEEYYLRSSSRQYLKKIQVPTLLVQSKDDPFMTQDVIPNCQELSEKVNLELTSGGGHVGFVAGKYPWRTEYWLEKRVPEFLKSHLR